MRALIFSLLLSLTASAQTQLSGTPTAADTKPGSIAGVVLRAGDNTPLRKAVVSLMSQGPQAGPVRPMTAATDTDGKFFFSEVRPGRYMLSVSRTGYAREMYGQRGPGNPGATLTVSAGQRITDLVLHLVPGGVITGRVVDEDSEPLSGVRVQVMRWAYMNGRRGLMPSGGGMTDDRGEYRIFGLTPGRYYVSAVFMGSGFAGAGSFIGQDDAGTEAYTPTYFPGVSDPAQAAPIDVRAGDEVPGINLRLVPSHAVRVSGRVRLATGEAPRGVSVNLFPRGAGMMRGDQKFAGVDEHGNFEIRGVAPGSYTALANSSADGKRVQARADVEVGNSDVDGVQLTLRPGVEIPGQVRLDSGADLKEAHLRVYLTPKDLGPFFGGGGPGQVKPDLTFTLTDVTEGDYYVRVIGLPEDIYVRSMRMGARDVLNDGLSIRGRAALLEITLSGGAGRLEGKVDDENNQPYSGARVVLVPGESRRERLDLFRTGTTDQYGRFSLRGIPPGKYTVFAWQALEEGAYQDPDFLRSVQDLGTSVEIGASSLVTQDLKLIPASKSGM
jgi:hypothetical protein